MNDTNGRTPQSIEAKASTYLGNISWRTHHEKYPKVNGKYTPVSKIAKTLKRSEQELRVLIEGRGLHIHFGRYVCIEKLKEILGMNGEGK